MTAYALVAGFGVGDEGACHCKKLIKKPLVLYTVDSKKLEYGHETVYAGFPSSLGFGVG